MNNEDQPQPVKRSLHGGTPPPRGRVEASRSDPRKPDLPRQRLPLAGGVYRDVKRTARQGEVDDVANALAVAGEAMEEGDVSKAIEYLSWAASRAPRSVPIREGLGVAYYLAGQFEEAQRELQAYRRISGRADQNHLLADCARALDRPDRVLELIDEMAEAVEANKVPLERLVEGLIVQAGLQADSGDYNGALATLDRTPLPDGLGPAHARTWYAAGDIAERMGDRGRAAEYFEAVMTVDDEFLDVAERLQDLI